MKAVDLRNATWADVLTHLTEDLVRVHLAYQSHGPGTTREIAQRSGISLLTLRPRTTDLQKVGLVILVDHEKSEGIYAYRTREDAEVSCCWQREADFRHSNNEPADGQRVGFVTVDDAVNSLQPAERAALGAKLLSAYGHHLKKRTAAGGAQQLELSPA